MKMRETEWIIGRDTHGGFATGTGGGCEQTGRFIGQASTDI